MDKINERIYQANIDLVDENKELKKIIDEAINYLEKMSFSSVVDNPKKDLIKILRKEKYE